MSEPRRFAVIDIGSNATRLLIGLVDEEGKFFREIFTRMPLALGGGTYDAARRIRAEKSRRLQQTISAMLLFMDAMRPVAARRVVATAALRDAANRAAVVAAVKRRCGIAVDILSGMEEAEIIGQFVAMQFSGASVLNIDVGGGSTDCALLENGVSARADSFAVGTARAGGGDAAEKTRLRRWLAQARRDKPLISGSGGSVRALNKICGKISSPQLATWRKKLTKMTPLQISERYGLSPDRAANIIAAVKIYQLILKDGGIMRPVSGGLAEAALQKLAAETPAATATKHR